VRIKPTVKWMWHKRKSTSRVLSIGGTQCTLILGSINSLVEPIPTGDVTIAMQGIQTTGVVHTL
jgi:hypothetical protein